MTVFIVLAAAMLAGVLFMLVPALRGRQVPAGLDHDALNIAIARERLAELDMALEAGTISAAQHAQDRAELERALAEELASAGTGAEARQGGAARWSVLGVAVAVPALAAALYAYLGSPSAFSKPDKPVVAAASGHPAVGDGQAAPTIDELVARLDARLRAQPDDPDGWYMLGRSYMSLKRYDEAAAAFARLRGLVGDQPDALLSHADALAMANGGRMSGEPFELVKKALAMRPNDTTGLWLAGLGYQEQGDDASALTQWRQLLPLLEGDAASAAEVRALIAQAEQRLGLPGDAATVAVATPPPAAGAKGITVEVALDPALAEKAQAGDTVFVFARAAKGPRMPLAVARRRVGDLPLTVTLDDSMAMNPALKLSNFSEVEVSARVSRSGNAIAQSGDLSADAAAVSTAAAGQPVRLIISRRLP